MWAQLMNALLGIWLMLAPAVLDYGAPMSISDRIVGPLVVSFALIAAWEITRAVRWVNVLLAVWTVASPFALEQHAVAPSHVIAGVSIAALSLIRGHSKHSYGGSWTSLGKADAKRSA
jgi:hypothetical protein